MRNRGSLLEEIEGGDWVEHGWREQGLAARKSVKSMLSKLNHANGLDIL